MMRLIICLSVLGLVLGCCPATDEISSLTDQEQQNKTLLEYVFAEGVNTQNLTVFDTSLSADYVRHSDAMPPGMREIIGTEMMTSFLEQHFAAFPDWHEELTQLVCQDDLIAFISVGTGTMTGDFGPFKATGRKIKITNIGQQRFKDGKIVETWITWDNLYFMEQAGLTPPPETPESENVK